MHPTGSPGSSPIRNPLGSAAKKHSASWIPGFQPSREARSIANASSSCRIVLIRKSWSRAIDVLALQLLRERPEELLVRLGRRKLAHPQQRRLAIGDDAVERDAHRGAGSGRRDGDRDAEAVGIVPHSLRLTACQPEREYVGGRASQLGADVTHAFQAAAARADDEPERRLRRGDEEVRVLQHLHCGLRRPFRRHAVEAPLARLRFRGAGRYEEVGWLRMRPGARRETERGRGETARGAAAHYSASFPSRESVLPSAAKKRW